MIDQWRTDVSRWGLARSGYIRLMTLIKPWITLCRVNVREQDPTAGSQLGASGLTVRMATRDDLLLAAQDPVMDLDPAEIDAALRRGDLCCAAFDPASDQERMVSYVWRSFTTAPHADGLWIVFERPHRYGYKSFTHPDYRGRHLQDVVSYVTDMLCIQRGYRYALSTIETHNFASITSNRRRGGRLVGWAGYIKLFGRVLPFRSRGARRHTFRFVKPGAPSGKRLSPTDQFSGELSRE